MLNNSIMVVCEILINMMISSTLIYDYIMCIKIEDVKNTVDFHKTVL